MDEFDNVVKSVKQMEAAADDAMALSDDLDEIFDMVAQDYVEEVLEYSDGVDEFDLEEENRQRGTARKAQSAAVHQGQE